VSNPYYDARAGAHFYPIVFIRGFAMRDADIAAAVTEPFSGFENGSTMLRQGVGDEIRPFYFESPVIRLITEFGYEDVYRNGGEPRDADALAALDAPNRSLWVYRYYEQASDAFGDGRRDPIETIAEGLHALVLRMQALYSALGEAEQQPWGEHFKVYLVAHSMGGLVVRSYLQKILPAVFAEAPQPHPVDKVFTYGTPHNGIELRGIGNNINIGFYDIANFYRPRMAEYLGLDPAAAQHGVNDLAGHFPPSRLFCLIGTNEGDYDVTGSAAAVGGMSDGLVRIANAYTRGSPRAHVHRAHGGPLGLVNSEDGYQNLQRFLFGDTRVEGCLELDALTLPRKLDDKRRDGHELRANLYFDSVVSVRGGKGWNLTRRRFDEQSAGRRELSDFWPDQGPFQPGRVALFSIFLNRRQIVTRSRYMAFVVELGVLADRFEVDRRWWLDDHFDGVSFFRDRLYVEIALGDDGWQVKYSTSIFGRGTHRLTALATHDDGAQVFEIPIEQRGAPGLAGRLRLEAPPWS